MSILDGLREEGGVLDNIKSRLGFGGDQDGGYSRYGADDDYADDDYDYEDDYTRELKRDISDFTRKHLTAINEEFELYIKTHLKLTDEDIATIKDLSSSQLLILVSGRMNNEE